jgi:glycosyltransferase involved in cell wall biosynthesis
LTEALSRLLENAPLRAEIGTAARRTVLRDFTVDHQAQRLAKLYGECAA